MKQINKDVKLGTKKGRFITVIQESVLSINVGDKIVFKDVSLGGGLLSFHDCVVSDIFASNVYSVKGSIQHESKDDDCFAKVTIINFTAICEGINLVNFAFPDFVDLSDFEEMASNLAFFIDSTSVDIKETMSKNGFSVPDGDLESDR